MLTGDKMVRQREREREGGGGGGGGRRGRVWVIRRALANDGVTTILRVGLCVYDYVIR